jgi:hypothetical protein
MCSSKVRCTIQTHPGPLSWLQLKFCGVQTGVHVHPAQAWRLPPLCGTLWGNNFGQPYRKVILRNNLANFW